MFKCGLYELDITPFLGGTIPGYTSRRVADGIKSKLAVKALALGKDAPEAVIIAFDGLYTTSEVCDGIYARVMEFTGVPAEKILVAATHNHTAATYKEYAENHQKDELYTQFLIRRCADCAVLAIRAMEEATVTYGCEKVKDVAFIRNYLLKDGSIRTNPGIQNPDIVEPVGHPDEDFPFLLFYNKDNKPMGALSSFSLHHDTVTGTEYCADFSGVLAAELKQTYGQDFVSVFLAGFCGNVNHIDVRIPFEERPRPVYIHTGKALFSALYANAQKAQKIEDPVVHSVKRTFHFEQRKVTAEQLEETLELMKKDPAELGKVLGKYPESPAFRRAKAPMLLEYAKTQDAPCEVIIQAIRIGDCMVYAANGELYVELQHYIKEKSPTQKNIFSSLSNGAFYGYLPTKEMYHVNTLYEAQLPSARLQEGTGEYLVEQFVEMAEELMQ